MASSSRKTLAPVRKTKLRSISFFSLIRRVNCRMLLLLLAFVSKRKFFFLVSSLSQVGDVFLPIFRLFSDDDDCRTASVPPQWLHIDHRKIFPGPSRRDESRAREEIMLMLILVHVIHIFVCAWFKLILAFIVRFALPAPRQPKEIK